MAGDLNRVILIGRLTRDPEVRSLPSGTMLTTFSIANNRIYYVAETKKEEVSFFECTAFGRTGETIAQYFKKGRSIAVEGRLRQGRWEDQEGNKKSRVEIVVEGFNFLSSKSEDSSMSGRSEYDYPGMGSQDISPRVSNYPGGEQTSQFSEMAPGSHGNSPADLGPDMGSGSGNPFSEDDIPF